MKSAVDKNTSVFPQSHFDRSSWKRIRLGDFESHRNNTCTRSQMTSDRGSVHNIHYGDILVKYNEVVSLLHHSVDYLTAEGETHSPKDYAHDGDIIIADTAEDEAAGKTVEIQDVANRKVVAGLHTFLYRPPSNMFVRGWLGYWMNSSAYHSQLFQYMTGTKVLSLTRASIASTIVQYPPKELQREIVTALDSIQTQINATQKLISKYEAIKKATVNLLMTNKAGWHRLRIKDVAQVYDGTHQTPHYTNSGIPFFSVENVTTNTFPGRKRISLEEHRKLTAKFQLRRGDVLMTRIGSIGDCRIVDWDYPSSFYVSLAAIHLNTEMVLPEFFVAYSKTKEFQEEVKIRSLPFAVPQKINLGPISQIQICVPAIKRQREIAAQISAIDDALKNEASCITVGLFDPDSGVKRCEHGARSAECLQRAA